jgi:DsbC/DsbD-like thiol-disulfide interchange protein
MFFIFQDNTPPVVTAQVPAHVAPHAAFQAKLQIKFAEGLHAYQNPPSDPYTIPVKISVKGSVAKLVKVSYPKGTPMALGGDPKPAMVYSGVITVPIKLTAGTKSGNLVFQVDYQQCNSGSCFPPASVTAKAALHVAK